VTIVVAGAPPGARGDAPEEPLEDELRRRVARGDPPTTIARDVARARGLRRGDVYEALERVKRGG
jgi:16S rRNA (cytidine1402-2'-O)-methyltransferase